MTLFAEPLPLGKIRLRGEFMENALAKEVRYLLSLDVGRLLAGFYENAGIPTAYVRYGGWENLLIGGHTMGHYLSAIAQAARNSGVPAQAREEFLGRIRRIGDAFSECGPKNGGLLWAAPLIEGGPAAQFDNVERARTNIVTEAWVPWYTLHKLLAGLIDAYDASRYAPVLAAASALGDWVVRRALSWDKETRDRVLSVEYGGMNDCLYELYARTGNADYARAAHVFDEEPLFDAILSEGKDVLKDRHANTTIPKVLGALKRYVCLDGKSVDGGRVDATRYLRVAEVFFRMVLERHTYVTGGNSEWEHFGADYVLDAERTNCNCETCNVYNMLKLARLLFCVTGDKYYTDYYDNAFTNSVLSSQNPETGMTTYFQPMASGYFKVFSRPYDKFWCCTGSGMENFTKLGDSAAYVRGNDIYLEQYLSMRVEADARVLDVSCNFPMEEEAEIRIGCAPAPFVLYLRVPDWANGAITLEKNGAGQAFEQQSGHIAVPVAQGDLLHIVIPVGVRLHGLPDCKDVFAFSYGGAVLSADLGTEDEQETTTGVDVTIPARRILSTESVYFPNAAEVIAHPERYLVRQGDRFLLTGGDVPFVFGLHYARFRERYAVYLHLRDGARRAEEKERVPIDVVQPGYGQYETDAWHSLREEHTLSETARGTSRRCLPGGWFSYDFRVDLSKKNVLRIRLRREDADRPLCVSVGEDVLCCGRVSAPSEAEEYCLDLPVPQDAVVRYARKKCVDGQEKPVLTVRFEGSDGEESARLCEWIEMFAD